MIPTEEGQTCSCPVQYDEVNGECILHDCTSGSTAVPHCIRCDSSNIDRCVECGGDYVLESLACVPKNAGKLSGGSIAGITIAVLLVVAIIIVVPIVVIKCRKSKREVY